jgi:hypothetical protein
MLNFASVIRLAAQQWPGLFPAFRLAFDFY